MPKQRLSLSWGPSFAEFDNGQEWLRFYTAGLPAPQLLKSKISQFPEQTFELKLSLSVMRRILETRLGHSVAQIVTKGFEHWVLLRQEAEPGCFDLAPKRREPLTNPENIFPIDERISSNGEVLQALDLNELEKICVTLKAKGIERVCINLLFSHRNPLHQKQISHYLRERGFQVFSQTRPDRSEDELSAWRRNLLDASLSSFFEKINSDLKEAAPTADLLFLDTEKGFVPREDLSTSGLLFGRERSLQREKPFLYFGSEEWCWILPEDQNLWKSPWGPLELTTPQFGFFSMQPGQELQLTTEGRIHWGEDAGLDPGPMLWGRSSKLTLLDLMGWHWETTPALRRTEKTEAKVTEQISALKRNSRDWKGLSSEKMQSEVIHQLLDSLFWDLSFQVGSDDFEVGGVLAPVLFPFLMQRRPNWNWTLIKEPVQETQEFWR